MDSPQVIPNDFSQEFTTWLRRKLYIIIGGFGAFLMVTALVINYVKTPSSTDQVVFTESENIKKIKIDIEGAVERPGGYEVTNDSRIQDVLITAGGLTPKANRIYLSQNINLAQRVYDGMKIYIPEDESNLSNLPNSTNLSNLININTATIQQLDTLPGVGEATAKKIIAGRPYQNISQLIELRILSQNVFSKLKGLITVSQ